MTQVSYSSAGVTAPANSTPNDAAFFRAILDGIMAGYNATDTTVSAAVAAGSGNGGKLAKFASDGSMSFAATTSFVAVNATGAVAAGGNLSTNAHAVVAGHIIAGSGSHQITTDAGLVDATQLTVPVPAPGTANNVMLSNGTAWTAAQLTSALLNALIADGSLAFAKVQELRVTATGTNLILTVAAGKYFDQNLNPVIFGGGTYTIPSGQVPSGGNNVWVVVYLSAVGTIGSVAGTPAVSPTRPAEQPNSQTLAYVYLRDGTTAVYQTDQSTAHTGYVEDWRNPWTLGGGSGGGGSFTFPLTISQGGTGATDPTNARTNIGAAASGVNSDLTQFNNPITFASALTQSGTYAAAATGSPLAHSVATVLKPTASGGVPRFVNVAGTVDMSGITANSTNNVNTAAGYYVGAVGRSGVHTRADMFDVWNLFTSNAGTPNGGTYTVADGQGHTTAAIAGTALVGALDGSTAGSINNALIAAGSVLRAVDGELPSGTSVNLVQTVPGPQAAPTIPTNTITTTSPSGGTLTLTQTTTAQIPLYSGVGVYVNQPQNNVSNTGVYVVGNLGNTGGVVGQSANEYGVYANMTIPALATYSGWQKTGMGSTVVVNQGRQTRTVGTVEGDAVAGDFTVYSNNGIAGANMWALHTVAKVGTSTGGGATGTAIGVEGQVISYSATDSGRIDSGAVDHQIGVNMVGGEPGGAGQQALTAAYVVSAVNNDLTGATKPYYHHGFLVTTKVANGGAAIGNGALDTAFELQDQWAVFLGGKMSIGSTTRISGNDLLEVLTGTNGGAVRVDQYAHQLSSQTTVPGTTVNTGAGSAAGGTASCLAGSTDQYGIVQVVTGSSAVAGTGATVTAVNFANAFPTAPIVRISPANAAARDLARNQDPAVTTTTTIAFFITSGQTALATGTTYQWSYRVN